MNHLAQDAHHCGCAENPLHSQPTMKCQTTRLLTPPFTGVLGVFVDMVVAPILHLILISTLFGACSWSQSLAIKHVTVIDATGHSPERNRTVIVDGEDRKS